MPLLLIGLNHNTSPLDTRERFALSSEQGERMLERIVGYARHAVVLATCNRTEIYTTGHNPEVGIQHLQRFLSDWGGIPLDELSPHLYRHTHWSALHHLFRVASGLDSMILGEEQILGQVRTAVDQAQAQGALDDVLETAFQHALRAGRRARAETGISRNAVSVSSVAVRLAREQFDGLQDVRVLVVSAGEAGKLATRTLAGQGVRHLFVTSRSYRKAQELAAAMGGQALPFDQLGDALVDVDFVISATGSQEHILTRRQMEPVVRQRDGRPLLLVDIAVPRDVDPAVAELPGVRLYNIDDVQRFAEKNVQLRTQEVAAAEAIVDHELTKFRRWWRIRQVAPTITALVERAEDIRAAEVSRTLGRLTALGENERTRVEAMSRAIVSKLLHGPLMYLKEERADGLAIEAETVRALFGLNTTNGARPAEAGRPAPEETRENPG